MTAPTPYDRQSSFALFSAENPSEPHSGTDLDIEFNAVKISLDETQQNLALIQDADGQLARASVGRGQLDSSITIGFGSPTPWAAGVTYTAEISTVFYEAIFYTCIETHVSGGSFDVSKWFLVADLSVAAALADGAVTEAKLADSAVTAAKIANIAVTTSKIATNAVSTVKIQDSAILTAKIADANVTTAKIADANVTTAKIVDLNITTAKLADDSVTPAKMANVVAGKLHGRYAGTDGDVQEITPEAASMTLDTTTGVLAAIVKPFLLPGFLWGLTLSAAGSTATFGVAAGVAIDSTNTTLMRLASAYTKTASAWAVGSGNGALDTGTIANSTWYHVFEIERLDTGVVDVLLSLSPTAPTMPANYTIFRRIGSMKTDGSAQWVKFTQIGDEFLWAAPVSDSQASTTSRANFTLTVPTGVVVMAKFKQYANPGGNLGFLYTSLLETSGGFGVGAADFYTSGGALGAANIERMTNTSAQIGVSSNQSATATVNTYAWTDTRGKS